MDDLLRASISLMRLKIPSFLAALSCTSGNDYPRLRAAAAVEGRVREDPHVSGNFCLLRLGFDEAL